MIKGYNNISLFGLEKEIINKIRKIEIRNLFLKQISYIVIALVSLPGIIASGIYTLTAIQNSGLYEYISLALTDSSSLTYWKEIVLSIVESIPSFELAVFFGISSLFLWAISKTGKIQILKSPLIATN